MIRIDITANGLAEENNTGRTMADLRMIGMMPTGDVEGLHVRVGNGVTVVRDSSTDEILVSGRGFAKTMEALSARYGMQVTVAADYGVSGGAVPKVIGTYGQPAEAETLPELAPVPSTPDVSVTGPGPVRAKSARAATDEAMADTEAWFAEVVKVSEASFAAEANREITGADVEAAPTPVIEADMRAQVVRTLGVEVGKFDIPWIVECLQRRFGTVNVDTIDPEEFWYTVRVHGSLHLLSGSAVVARIAPAGSVAVADANAYVIAVSPPAAPVKLKPRFRTLMNRRARKAAK